MCCCCGLDTLLKSIIGQCTDLFVCRPIKACGRCCCSAQDEPLLSET